MKGCLITVCSLLFFIACDKNDSVSDIPDKLEGQWVLDRVVCFCYFGEAGNENFDEQQLWFYKNQLYPIGPNNNIPNIVSTGKVYDFNLRGNLLTVANSDEKYTLEISGDTLSLTFVDNPRIADDEISFYFKKGSADPSCVDFSAVIEDGICTMEYAPVCGCNSMTYSNACEAQNAGVMNWENGVCERYVMD